MKQSINPKVNQSKMFTNVYHIMITVERLKQSIKHCIKSKVQLVIVVI